MPGSRHLRRLRFVFPKTPVYFVTTSIHGRRHVLADDGVHTILREEWIAMRERHGWSVGRYVVMPDHVHFLASPARPEGLSLSAVIGRWKAWTARGILAAAGLRAPLWQPEFFDHLLRSDESRAEEWDYIRLNPVRAGLVLRAEDWHYAGNMDFE